MLKLDAMQDNEYGLKKTKWNHGGGRSIILRKHKVGDTIYALRNLHASVR